MTNLFLMIRHGLFFGITISLPLWLLSYGVRRVAARWGHPTPDWKWDEATALLAWSAGVGVGAQLFFSILHGAGAPSVATRWAALTLVCIAIALRAERVVPYYSRWKGVLWGALAAIPATLIYQEYSSVAEGTTRALIAAVIVGTIALAVTLPVPVETDLATATHSRVPVAGRFRPTVPTVRPSGEVRPGEFRVKPSKVTFEWTNKDRFQKPGSKPVGRTWIGRLIDDGSD